VTEAEHPVGAARRRRRRPHGQADGDNAPTPTPPPVSAEDSPPVAQPAAARRDRRASSRDPERGWRDLAGNSPSQVGVGGAMRARDVARPTAADLEAAERDLVIVRRQWQPPDAANETAPASSAGNRSARKQ